MTSTTDGRIDGLIAGGGAAARANTTCRPAFSARRSSRCRPTRFALVAVDTGVLRRIDRGAGALARGALQRAAGKTTMAILGHPFFAGGHDMTARRRGVRAAEAPAARPRRRHRHGRRHARPRVLPRTARRGCADVYYFVNGGGGAYLSFGTALELAGRAADAATGRTIRTAGAVAGKIEARHALVETPGLVVDDAVRRVAVLGRVAVGGVRLQRGAVLPELRRGERRTVGASRAHRALRRARPPQMGGRRGISRAFARAAPTSLSSNGSFR